MLTGWRLAVSKLFIIPQRYVMALMGFFGVTNSYAMRVVFNLAITQMVKRTPVQHRDVSLAADSEVCPDLYVTWKNDTNSTLAGVLDDKLYDWDEATQGLLLGAYYYGYMTSQIPGGILADKYGCRWVLGLSIMFTAIFTALIPWSVKIGGVWALFAVRALQGLSDGPTVSGLLVLIAQWAPREEKARFSVLVFGGMQVGNVVASYFSGLIMNNGYWEDAIYLFSGVTFIWCIVWFLICYNGPDVHPFITDAEKEYLTKSVDAQKNGKKVMDPVPWKAIFRSLPFWAFVAGYVGYDFVFYLLLTDLPKYMSDVLKFDIRSVGLLAAVPFLCFWLCSFIYGTICDFCVERGYVKIKNARRICGSIATIGPGVCMLAASYSGCDAILAVIWFTLATSCMGAIVSGVNVNPLDICPTYAGTVTSIANTLASATATFAPYMVGVLAPDSTLSQWRISFWICLSVLLVADVFFVIFVQGGVQWWDDVTRHGYPENWKHGPLTLAKQKDQKKCREKCDSIEF